MTELELFLMMPAIACTTIGGILLGIDKLHAREAEKNAMHREERRRRQG